MTLLLRVTLQACFVMSFLIPFFDYLSVRTYEQIMEPDEGGNMKPGVSSLCDDAWFHKNKVISDALLKLSYDVYPSLRP